jgi:pSer/pThr/pTyr-binding forkhead associated (FHA) protein
MVEPKNAPEASLHVAVQLLDSALGRPVRSWQFEGKQVVSIGRGEDQHVQISDPYVSRNHAELRYQNGQWVLVSLGRYGVLMQGQAITEVPIEKETTFRLGSEGPTLRFDPAVARNDNRMTMMFDSTLVQNMFELDQKKVERDVGEIAEANYFQELQKRAQQLRKLRDKKEDSTD